MPGLARRVVKPGGSAVTKKAGGRRRWRDERQVSPAQQLRATYASNIRGTDKGSARINQLGLILADLATPVRHDFFRKVPNVKTCYAPVCEAANLSYAASIWKTGSRRLDKHVSF